MNEIRPPLRASRTTTYPRAGSNVIRRPDRRRKAETYQRANALDAQTVGKNKPTLAYIEALGRSSHEHLQKT